MSRRPKRNVFQIVEASNGKVIRTVYSCASEELVNKRFKELIEENDKIRFPVRYINVGKLIEAKYELFIIKRNDDDSKITKLKDENGKITNFETDDEDWVIYDRENYDREETFWVYGYHPVFQRKTFKWIYERMLLDDVGKYNIKQVFVFRNKLLISTTYKLSMVLCKNESDCIRLYNELEREVKEKKDKYVYFSGDAYHSKLKKEWYDRIMKLTGWPFDKVRRKSLRP